MASPLSTLTYPLIVLFLASFLALSSENSVKNADGTTSHHLHFMIIYTNVARLCNGTKEIITVNGKFPGPTIYVRTGDHVNIKVSNRVNENVTIHWHGIRQMLSVWADGPAYITQCPLQPKEHYNHNFTVVREQGTLFWHAHLGWQRGTLYGAFIILPPKGQSYAFPIQPKAEFPLLLECKDGAVCQGPGPRGASVGTNINNVTFKLPSVAILQAYYQQLHTNDSSIAKWDTSLAQAKGTYEEDFPSTPCLNTTILEET
ncbi:hypothetical protein GOP47_0010385 [Adiantum capillus-veneris]|uniref:Plastocyanin-like domain-containing protein n=1 Tax=Adiantum capillus-veneris TaxID=13818 RepID=A0A9D4ZGC3_ADICA|nr:hypothetical protein GOP47_0010385 [Adiantum capillus-veneris]